MIAVVALSSACFPHRNVVGVPERDARISVRFADPTDVVVVAAWGDTIRMSGVTELRGRVEGTITDTLYLRVTGASGPDLAFRDVPVGGLAAIATQPHAQLRHRKFSPGRSAVLVFGTAGALAVIYVVALFAALPTF